MRGILFMVAAMACFAVEDAIVKQVSRTLPVGEILMMMGAGGSAVYATLARATGRRLISRDLLAGAVVLRNIGDMAATMCYVTALALTPISTASAIIQAVPLAVTLGAAVFLGAPVGWRRWSAISVGLAGVLLIIRPGAAGFELASLFAVAAVAGLALRDLATRQVPAEISTFQVAAYAFSLLLPAGAILLALGGAPRVPDAATFARLVGALTVGIAGYYAVIASMRVGDVAVVPAFRYVRLIFALAIGVTVFDEILDAWTLTGVALIVGSGLYTLMRERAARAQVVSSPTPGR